MGSQSMSGILLVLYMQLHVKLCESPRPAVVRSRMVQHCWSEWKLQICLPQGVVEWLTVQPQVHWISPRAQTKASNFFATGISQCGSAATLADASNAAGASGDAGTHPMWDAGLNQYSLHNYRCIKTLL